MATTFQSRGAVASVPLESMSSEDKATVDLLVPAAYRELRRIAHAQLSRRYGATLATTGLVNEVYLRLVNQSHVRVRDRTHFLALAALAMRHVLADQAKSRRAQKRGGSSDRVTFDEETIPVDAQPGALLEIHEALDRLVEIDARLARVVVLRFFGGLSHEEIADADGVAVRTVERDWAKARTLLKGLLGR